MITLDELLYGQACSSIAPEDIRIMIESRFGDLLEEHRQLTEEHLDLIERVDELTEACEERTQELTDERKRHESTRDKVREARKLLESIA